MDHYSPVLRKFLENLFRLWFQRIQEKLDLCAEALDQWLHELFSHPTPDWRDRFEQFLAQQEAAGYIVEPQSRQDLLDYLEGWAKTVDWDALERGTRVGGRPVVVVAAAPETIAERPAWQREIPSGLQPRDRGRTLGGGRRFFSRRLQAAKHHLDEMERILQALGQKLDAAKVGEEVEVESEVDAIEALIWSYNDALEKVRDAWLRHDLGSEAYTLIEKMGNLTALNLPPFLDQQQANRFKQQEKEISRRLDQRIGTLDRVVLGMQIAEGAGTAASILLGGGALLTVVREGGKWVAVKAAAKNLGKAAAVAGSAIAAEQAAEHGLRAAGASEGTIRGVRLAAEVVAIILLRRRIRSARVRTTPSRKHVPEELPPFDPKQTIGAAKAWTIKARLKAAQLPIHGKIRYVPPKGYTPGQPLLRGPNHGYLDRFGNEWLKGPSRTPGQAFEWDVQLGKHATQGIRMVSPDGKHINVSLDGEITH